MTRPEREPWIRVVKVTCSECGRPIDHALAGSGRHLPSESQLCGARKRARP